MREHTHKDTHSKRAPYIIDRTQLLTLDSVCLHQVKTRSAKTPSCLVISDLKAQKNFQCKLPSVRNSRHDASANRQWFHRLLERASVRSALPCGVKIRVLSPPALSAFVCVPHLSLCPLVCFTPSYICVVSCHVTFCLVCCLSVFWFSAFLLDR